MAVLKYDAEKSILSLWEPIRLNKSCNTNSIALIHCPGVALSVQPLMTSVVLMSVPGSRLNPFVV